MKTFLIVMFVTLFGGVASAKGRVFRLPPLLVVAKLGQVVSRNEIIRLRIIKPMIKVIPNNY